MARIKMAEVIVTLKIMPVSPDIDLDDLKTKAKKIIKEAEGEIGKEYYEEIAFGIKAIILIFIRNEAKGSVDDISDKIAEIEEVSSTEITDVRRAIG